MQQAIARLTERQKDCLRLVGQGYTSKQIGRQLGISYTTVDNHVRAALEVLQADSRAEAARLLLAAETDQPLTSQPPALVEPALSSPTRAAVEDGRRSWLLRWIPPLGGQRNALGGEAKAYAIIRVAVLALASVIILTIAAAVLLWITR